MTRRELIRKTSLSNREVASVLAVLVQHHLAFHCTTSDTYYQAHGSVAYNTFFRTAKLAEMAKVRYGPVAAQVMIATAALGMARIPDLEKELGTRANAVNGDPERRHNGTAKTNGTAVNGTSKANRKPSASTPQTITRDILQRTVATLVRAGFLRRVTSHTLVSDSDLSAESEKAVTSEFIEKNDRPPKSGKEKIALAEDALNLKRKWRDKMDTDAEASQPPRPKKKLKVNGDANGINGRSRDLTDHFTILVRLPCLIIRHITDQMFRIMLHTRRIGKNVPLSCGINSSSCFPNDTLMSPPPRSLRP
jgi:hypothetical protein